MDDDDDVPDELWDMLDTISLQKNQTVSQAPNRFQKQQQVPPVSANTGASTFHSNTNQWRPNLVQQLPLAAPPKPKSLAQQLLGDSTSTMPRPGASLNPGLNPSLQNPANTRANGFANGTQQRWTPPPQVQQQYPQQPWVSATPGSSSTQFRPGQQPQQQQQWPVSSSNTAGAAQRPPSNVSAVLAAELGLPPLQTPAEGAAPAHAAAAAPGAIGAAAAGGGAAAAGQQQQGMDYGDVLRLRQEAEQLRSRLQVAEREKQQLQQERQLMQQRMGGQSQNSLAQHRAQELQRQVATYQERLKFAEQEASEALGSAAEKAARAREAEAQLKHLQEDVRRKEDMLQQLQVELDQEKQRTQRLAAAGTPAAGAGAPGASSSMQQQLHPGLSSPVGGSNGKVGGTSTRKRKGAAAAAAAGGSTPGLSSAVKSGLVFTTPQQQLRNQQVAQLLGVAPATSVSFDLDMYDDVEEEHQQQQQQHVPSQQRQQQQQQPSAKVQTPPAAAAHQQQQQPVVPAAQQNIAGAASAPGQAAQQQQQQQQVPLPQPQEQAQQQPDLSSSMMGKLLPPLQRLQVSTPSLPQILWSSCQPAMQQLLQPLQGQLLGLDSILAAAAMTSPSPAAAAAAVGGASGGVGSSLTQLLPSALSAAQQQLAALTAGAVGSGRALCGSLLQLWGVLVPEGPLGACSSSTDADSSGAGGGDTTAAAAAVQEAFPVSSEPHSRHPKWLLLPQQAADAGSAFGRYSSGFVGHAALPQGQTEQQQQQQQPSAQVLMFRSAADAAVLHVLPLNLAVAVLQLLTHLACHDDTCLSKLAAELSSRCSSSSAQVHSHGWGVSSSGSGHGSKMSSSERVQLEWVQEPQQDSAGVLPQRNQQQQQWRSSLMVGNRGWLAAAGTGPQQHTNLHAPALTRPAGESSSSSRSDHQQQQQQRDLGVMLGDAANCHPLLLLHVGRLLAAVAAQLPNPLQPLLLAVALSDQQLLLLLLQADASSSRCTAAALLQCMLGCPAVPAAFAAALTSGGDQQQQQQDGEDVILRDAIADQTTALQPLNNRSAVSTRATAADSSRQGKAQQQQGAAAAAAATGSHADQQQQQNQQPPQLSCQAVREVLLQVLEAFSFGLDEAFQTLQQQQQHSAQHPGIPNIIFATTSTTTTSSSSSSRSLYSSSPSAVSPAFGAGASAIEPAQAWGVFELQRRCCAVFAGLLHGRQELLLQYCTDTTATAGYGLAQRLLVMVGAACSPVGGDPFAALTPTLTAAAAAAAGAGGSVCGSPCSWQGCMERVRLAHEGLLLLRALVATAGTVGTSAMADLCSNSSSLRLIMTTRAKLAEVTAALTAAAAADTGLGRAGAPVSSSSSRQGRGSSSSSSVCADVGGVKGLPLQPWAWPWSTHCGCKSKPSSSSSSSGAAGSQVLHVQAPPLHAVLQEMTNTAASIHRRVMIYLRAQESAMQA